MPILTVDGSVLPDGVELYEYEGEELFVLVQVLSGLTRSIEAKNPLIILADKPEEVFKASSCMLPLTSGGHVLFTDGEKLQSVFSESELSNYGTIKILICCHIEVFGESVVYFLVQQIVFAVCSFISVLPIIILGAQKENGYLFGSLVAAFLEICGIFLAPRGLCGYYAITAGLEILNFNGEMVGGTLFSGN